MTELQEPWVLLVAQGREGLLAQLAQLAHEARTLRGGELITLALATPLMMLLTQQGVHGAAKQART